MAFIVLVFLCLHGFVKPIAYSISADTNVLSGTTSVQLGNEDMRWDLGEASLYLKVTDTEATLPPWLSGEGPSSKSCAEEGCLVSDLVVFPGPGTDFKIERLGAELRMQLSNGRGKGVRGVTARIGRRNIDGEDPIHGTLIIRVDLDASNDTSVYLDIEADRLLLGRDPDIDRVYGSAAFLTGGAVSGFVGVRTPFSSGRQLTTYEALSETLNYRDAIELSNETLCGDGEESCLPIHGSAVIDPATESVSGDVIHAAAVTPEPRLVVKRPHFSKEVTIDILWHQKLAAIPNAEIIISMIGFLISIIGFFLERAE